MPPVHIFRRRAGFMDRASPPRNPTPPSTRDLLVQAGDQGGLVLGFLVLAVAEDLGGAFGQDFLPSLNLARADFVPGGQWAT